MMLFYFILLNFHVYPELTILQSEVNGFTFNVSVRI